MIKGKAGKWYQDKYVGGYFAEDGNLIVCEEYGLTDADTDKYAIQVQNGDGYYDSEEHYRSYGKE